MKTNIEWLTEPNPIPYEDALTSMQERAAAIRKNNAPEMIWLLEHPPIYTAGRSARTEDLIDPRNTPTIQTGRGGEWTWHGPGQRIVYIMLDVSKRGSDLRQFVYNIEEWASLALKSFGLNPTRSKLGHPGVWLGENKVVAIGIRVSKWVSMHGMAINLNPDLNYFNGIIPCGITDGSMTSLHQEGAKISMQELDEALSRTFSQVFA